MMTFEEYKALVKEHRETNSIKRRDEIEGQIYSAAKKLLRRLTALHWKYGKDYVDDSDYQEDKGWISMTRFDSVGVGLVYSDRWQYGGECDIGIGVPMKYLDEDCLKRLEDELIADRVKALKAEIARSHGEIEGCKKTIAECENELARLEGKQMPLKCEEMDVALEVEE